MTPAIPLINRRPVAGASSMTFKTKPFLSIDNIKAIANECEQSALAMQRQITFAIVDEGGALLNLLRMEGAPATGAEIAPAKARLAALGRRESAEYENMITGGKMAFLSALSLPGIRGAGLEGGVPILVEGFCIGAVGVAGASSSEDAEIARRGIANMMRLA